MLHNSGNSDEDKALIVAYQNGDGKSFSQLINKYWEYIFKMLLYKRVPSSEAEDCTQDICVSLIRTLKTLKVQKTFKSYLDQAINRKAMDYFRRGLKNRPVSLFGLSIRGDGTERMLIDIIKDQRVPGSDEEAIYKDEARIFGLCLGLVRNQTMRILVCLWLKGFQYREMAELLRITMSKATVSLVRVKKMLQNCISEKYSQKGLFERSECIRI